MFHKIYCPYNAFSNRVPIANTRYLWRIIASRNQSNRHNFSKHVKKVICSRAGWKCCKCYATTYGGEGQAAHIKAASPGGPRFDPDITEKERKSTSNGIWLCATCHQTVDETPETYTPQQLRTMKERRENMAYQELRANENRVERRRHLNIPQSMIEVKTQVVYKRSGGHCEVCGALLFGPHPEDPDKYLRFGEITFSPELGPKAVCPRCSAR